MKYKIKESNEDPRDTVIEKTGHKIHFTMREVEKTQAVNKTNRQNIEAKCKVEKAKIINIEENHAFVKDMSEQDLHTVYMYFEAKKIVEMAEAKLKEFDEQEKELNKELDAIKKQIPDLGIDVTELKTEE